MAQTYSQQRLLDLALASLGLMLAFPFVILLLVIGLFDTGKPLFLQERVGRNTGPFTLIKFRTMKLNTASVATHLADADAVTSFGKLLRSTKLDELPQLWNVLKGEMSLVGPQTLPLQSKRTYRRARQTGCARCSPGYYRFGSGQRNEHVRSGEVGRMGRENDRDDESLKLL